MTFFMIYKGSQGVPPAGASPAFEISGNVFHGSNKQIRLNPKRLLRFCQFGLRKGIVVGKSHRLQELAISVQKLGMNVLVNMEKQWAELAPHS